MQLKKIETFKAINNMYCVYIYTIVLNIYIYICRNLCHKLSIGIC